MYKYKTKIRVRYAETDQMGYVYYGNYATYYEVARTESLRELGFTYRKLEEQGVLMPVLELKCKYIRPARYDDLLTIEVAIAKRPSTRMVFSYEVKNEAGELLNVGETTLVFVNKDSGKPCDVPEIMKQLLYKFY